MTRRSECVEPLLAFLRVSIDERLFKRVLFGLLRRIALPDGGKGRAQFGEHIRIVPSSVRMSACASPAIARTTSFLPLVGELISKSLRSDILSEGEVSGTRFVARMSKPRRN